MEYVFFNSGSNTHVYLPCIMIKMLSMSQTDDVVYAHEYVLLVAVIQEVIG